MACKDCDSSSLTYSRCNPLVSSDCVSYQGEKLTCSSDENFTICKGEIMTEVQKEIFEKICSLSNSIDVTTVTIPDCPFVKEAWDENDPTILNLFNLALQLECDLKAQIDELDGKLDTNNPIITGLNLCCCSVDCDTNTAEIRLSDALRLIVECVCAARAEAKAALDTANAANDKIATLETQVNLLQDNVDSLVAAQPNILLRLCKIETYFTNEGIPLPSC